MHLIYSKRVLLAALDSRDQIPTLPVTPTVSVLLFLCFPPLSYNTALIRWWVFFCFALF